MFAASISPDLLMQMKAAARVARGYWAEQDRSCFLRERASNDCEIQLVSVEATDQKIPVERRWSLASAEINEQLLAREVADSAVLDVIQCDVVDLQVTHEYSSCQLGCQVMRLSKIEAVRWEYQKLFDPG